MNFMSLQMQTPRADSTTDYRTIKELRAINGDRSSWRSEDSHFTSWPCDIDMRMNNYRRITFGLGAMRSMLAKCDPQGLEIWEGALTQSQWEHWELAVNTAHASTDFCIMGNDLIDYCDFMDEIQRAPNVQTVNWLKKLFTLTNSTHMGSMSPPMEVKYDMRSTSEMTTSVQEWVHWLYCAHEWVSHFEQLLDQDTTQPDAIAVSTFFAPWRRTQRDASTRYSLRNKIFFTYELLRPAADLWRDLPWQAIAPFETLGGARTLLKRRTPSTYWNLYVNIASKGIDMDGVSYDVPQAENWWKWADHEIAYFVDLGLSPFSSHDKACARATCIETAMRAFDPANPVNVQVLDAMEAFVRPSPTSPEHQTYVAHSRIPSASHAHALLSEYHAFLQQVMLAAHAPSAAAPPMKRPQKKVKPIASCGLTYGTKAKTARAT